MTQEEKQLLVKDLCARLPYRPKGVRLSMVFDPKDITIVGYSGRFVETVDEEIEVERVRLYLRPTSSMTKEELKEMNEKYGNIAYFFIQEPPYYHGLQAQHSDIGSIEISEFSEIYDWLNAHHFDFRGLIEKGLALETKPEMYKI